MIFVSAFDSLLALLRVDHLAHVLCHKVTLQGNKCTILNTHDDFNFFETARTYVRT